uniref:Uncharacterized protein n=1 Tax=viral metagenome TaxID=1070528 RepID=A0A6M3LDR7_9ZZZZ
MKEVLEEMIAGYKSLVETAEMTPTERVFRAKRRRDLWWEIRQEIKDLPKAIQIKVYRTAHPEKVFEQWLRQRDKSRALKLEVLTHYGKGECVCVKCGFNNIRALSIDHIEGGGNRHRKSKLRPASSFYTWLKAENYPTGYQTLCMNCQFIKRDENNEQGKYAVEPIDWQNVK